MKYLLIKAGVKEIRSLDVLVGKTGFSMNAKEISVALRNVRNEYVAEAVTYQHICRSEMRIL